MWCLASGWVCAWCKVVPCEGLGVWCKVVPCEGWICGGSVYEIIIYNRYVAYQTNPV